MALSRSNSQLEDNETVAAAATSCTKSFFEESQEFFTLLAQVVPSPSQDAGKPLVLAVDALVADKLIQILERYQEQPHLLDPHLEEMVTPVVRVLRYNVDKVEDTNGKEDHQLYRFLYILTKVRGYKTVVKFLSHEAADLEPLLAHLQRQDRNKHALWETRYVLLLWLSLVARIPFDLSRLDSAGSCKDSGKLIEQLVETGKSFLSATGKEREGAAELLARILSRRDTTEKYLNGFVKWSMDELTATSNGFLAIGIFHTLATVFKHGQRSSLIEIAHPLIPVCELVMTGKSRFSNNTHVRKLVVKLCQRIGMSFLKPRIAKWRYKRGHRSLLQNLAPSEACNVTAPNAQPDECDEEQEQEIPEELESVIDILLNGLQDKDTIVRWSASKGVGRIAQRLSLDFAQEIIASIIDLFSENTFMNAKQQVDISNVSDQTWHGACLALAELSRRGLLLPEKLPEVIAWIEMALKFDQKRGSFSVGAHVRDAACYVCWSFARAYSPDIMRPFVERLSTCLVIVSIFDREVNVRRASSAAFQENVGRQGIFPHGIDIVTTADYFAVGNRTAAYTELSKDIARFEEYLVPILDYLCTTAIFHWDIEMRLLTSRALNGLTPFCRSYMVQNAIPKLIPYALSAELNSRHGAMVAIAEISLAFGSVSELPAPELSSLLVDVMQKYPSYVNSFGSDIYRRAVCRYISCLSTIHLPLTLEERSVWLSLLDSSLERKEQIVQEEAAAAFRCFSRAYPLTADEIRGYHRKIELTSDTGARRGFCLAVGYIPPVDLKQHGLLDETLRRLCTASFIHEDKACNDPEARRNAVFAVTELLISCRESFASLVSPEFFQHVFDAYLNGMNDYATDSRGDIGSWVREACMQSMKRVCCMLLESGQPLDAYMTHALTTGMVSKVLQQSVEKIDKVRACAGDVLRWAIDVPELKIHGRPILQAALPKSLELNWHNPSEVYARLIPVLHIPQYRLHLLSGIVVSVGGMTESLVRHSSSAFTDFVQSLPVETNSQNDESMSLLSLAEALNTLFEFHPKEDRIILPLLEVWDILFGAGLWQPLLERADKEGVANLMKSLVYIRKEVTKCRDIRKVLAGIKVFCGFASCTEESLRTKSLQYLLTYLVHPFPKIRRFTAEQLYIALTSLPEEVTFLEEKVDAIEEILVGTNWDLEVKELKAVRDQLFPLLGVTPLVASTPTGSTPVLKE